MTNLLLLGFLPSGSEWIIIALVILLLFGGKKIPELMRGLGKGAVCVYGNLGAVEAHCVDADAFESHREQADGDLFAGTCNDVELPGILSLIHI